MIMGMSNDKTEKQPILPFVYKDKKVELVHAADAVPRSYEALDNLRLSKLEFQILNMVGKNIVMTHAITHSFLKQYDVKYQEVVNAFRKLLILELVNGYRTKREGDIYESPWIYTLSNNGVYVLKSRTTEKKVFYTVLKTDFIKEKLNVLLGTLITNALIMYLQKLSIHRQTYVRPLLKWEEVGEQKQFMPQVLVNLLHLRTQKEFSMFVEPVRRNEGWKEEIESKLTKYAFFYINESYKKCNLIKPGKPVIMLILEDKKHMEELAEHIAMTPNEGFFKKNNVLITTDWDIRDIEDLNLYKGVYKMIFEEDQLKPKYAYVNFLT